MKASADSADLLDIAVAALRGEDVAGRPEALPPRLVGYGRQAAQLANFAPMLPESTRADFIARLEQAGVGVEAEVARAGEARQALLARIAEVQATQAGLNELYAISRGVDASAMSREDYEAYDAAFQAKRSWVQAQLQAKADAAEKHRRSSPAPVAARVDALLDGDDVEDVEFAGLPLGAPVGKLGSVAQQQWGYKQSPTLSIDEKQFTPSRKTMSDLLERESRSGGFLFLRTHNGEVGMIRYWEHYPGPVPVGELEAHLRNRFGSPDDSQTTPASTLATWKDGDRYLEVEAGRRIAQHMQNQGVQSSMEIRLWTEDFSDYLEEAEERCERLADKPRNRLSKREAAALAMGCLEP
jgi:hypothetical protein